MLPPQDLQGRCSSHCSQRHHRVLLWDTCSRQEPGSSGPSLTARQVTHITFRQPLCSQLGDHKGWDAFKHPFPGVVFENA